MIFENILDKNAVQILEKILHSVFTINTEILKELLHKIHFYY